jgi:hypothetical protein
MGPGPTNDGHNNLKEDGYGLVQNPVIAAPRGIHEVWTGRVQAQANDGHNNLKEARYGLVQNPSDM